MNECFPRAPAKKVTIYLNEERNTINAPLYDSILAFLMHRGMSGATVTRAHQMLHESGIREDTEYC